LPSTPSSAPSDAPPDAPARGHRALLAAIAAVIVAVVVAVTVVIVLSSGDDAPRSRASDDVPIGAVEPGSIEVGQAVPDFTLPSLSGDDEVRLSDFRGQPVVINFWASWCHPCRKEFPLLADANEKYAGDDLAIIGVTYRDIPSDSRAFARDQKAEWTLARDDRGAVAKAYGVRAIPQTFFVDADGVVAERVFGITSSDDLDNSIRNIVPRTSR
jgi:peroxiredoxin